MSEFLLESSAIIFEGMHEILDLIREQDGKSDVKIQTESLEKLISVLDASVKGDDEEMDIEANAVLSET